jgi:predicted RNase H-like nuclease (RuvC/YqgF family)
MERDFNFEIKAMKTCLIDRFERQSYKLEQLTKHLVDLQNDIMGMSFSTRENGFRQVKIQMKEMDNIMEKIDHIDNSIEGMNSVLENMGRNREMLEKICKKLNL